MVYALFFAFGFIVFILWGILKQHKESKYLSQLIKKHNGKTLVFSLNEMDGYEADKYVVAIVDESELSDSKSDLRRLMKKTGVQKLPCAFRLNTQGKVAGEIIRNSK